MISNFAAQNIVEHIRVKYVLGVYVQLHGITDIVIGHSVLSTQIMRAIHLN